MSFRLFIVSILVLIGFGSVPLPLAAQRNDMANGQFESARPFPATSMDSRTAPKPITPRERNASTKADESAAKPSGAGSVWTTFGSLAVVIFLILIIGRSWKKHGPSIGGQIPPEAVELLGRKHIDARQTLHLVRLGSRILLLGSSSTAGLRTLAEVTDPIDVDFLAGVCRQSTTDGTVAQTFRALFNRRSASDDSFANQQASKAGQTSPRTTGDGPRFHPPDLEEVRG